MKMKKAFEILNEEVDFDYIIESHNGGDFVEFVLSLGGDILRRRVYENGEIYAK